VKKWHSAGDTIARDTTGTLWQRKLRKDKQRKIDVGRARNAKMAEGTKA
jgi:hypothetical protein